MKLQKTGLVMLKLKSFKQSQSGTVAMIYALIALASFVLIGGGLDFSKHRTQSVIVQTALDATALHMLQETDLEEADFQEKARFFFDSNLSGFNAELENFSIERTNETVVTQATAQVETFFLGLIGIENLGIMRIAEGVLTTETREIALVLDTTSSMQGDRITNLISASNLLLDRLEESSTETSFVNVGIVPFDQYVRVNTATFPEEWLDVEGESDVATELFGEDIDLFDLFDHLGQPWEGCVRSRMAEYAFTDEPVDPTDVDTLFTPLFAYDEGDDGSYTNNYLTDAVAHPDGESSVRSFLKYGIQPGAESNPNAWADVTLNLVDDNGPNQRCASEPITPLTNDYDALRDTINNLTAEGDTNLTEAIMWGQRVLSSEAPFTEGLPEDQIENRKILIFLSDGINSIDGGNADLRSVLSAQGYASIGELSTFLPPSPTEDDINDYLNEEFATACETIKEANTQLIVIRLELTDAASQQLLSDCASSEADFFNVPDAAQLDEVFSQLVTRITSAHLTR